MGRHTSVGNQHQSVVGMRVTHTIFTDYHDRFAPKAFDEQVGKIIPLTFVGRVVHLCKVTKATVADDGLSVELEMEIL